jgi:hypothetical protein
MVKVGIYWANIKGRFGGPKAGRIYLALKYGMRWRAKTLINRFIKVKDT